MSKEFRFLAGMPRSGSTVLATLLSQHPDLHTSATSVLRDLLHFTRHYNLGESPYFARNGEQVANLQRAMMQGFYAHVAEPVVLEKDRGWANECGLLELLLGERPRVVATTRRVSETIASFFLVADRAGATNKIDDEVRAAGREVTPWTRSRIIWEKYLYANWRVFKAGYEAHPECFLLVDYEDIVADTKRTIATIHTFFDLERSGVRPTELVNPSPENDAVYGIPGLHDVRPTLERTSPPPEEVLGEEVCAFWDEKGLEFWKE